MPTGTKRGYALILASATTVAFATALLVLWASGVFDQALGFAGWAAIAALLGLGWICGGMLVSFLFLGARTERNASLAEARVLRRGRPRRPERPHEPGRL